MVFLIDGSESISDANFNLSLDWALTALDKFDPKNRTEGLQVFLVQYSKNARLDFKKMINDSSSEIRSDVKSISKLASGTRTYEALKHVNDEVFPMTRNDAFKILITMTDGTTADERDQDEIQRARSNFNVMVAVSVGAEINDEIRDFAYRVEPIYVTDFESLKINTGIFTIILNSTYTGNCESCLKFVTVFVLKTMFSHFRVYCLLLYSWA